MNELLLLYLRHPKSLQYLVCAGLLLVLPSLAVGLFADDFGHYVLIHYPELVPQTTRGSLFHLFAFIDSDNARREFQYSQSLIPWWTSDHLKINFWRPVSEITHIADYYLLGGVPWLMHIHSLVWYGLLLISLSLFYKRLFGVGLMASLALLLFVADSTHGMTVSWIANRNALLAAVFGLLSFESYLQYRECSGRWRLLACCGFLLVGLLSAEIAVSAMAFFVAYAIFLDKQGVTKGLVSLWPVTVVIIVWFLIYSYLGYGISGNDVFYTDPVTQPFVFFSNLLVRFPVAVSVQFNLLPFHLVESLETPVIISGFLIFIALLVIACYLKDAVLNFFLLALVLSILPVASTVIQDRNMLFVGIIGAAILARLIACLMEPVTNHRYQKITSVLLVTIVLFHLVFSAILMLPMSLAPKLIAQSSIKAAISFPEGVADKQVVSFGVPLFDASYLSAIRQTRGLPLPDKFWNITCFSEGVRVKRLSENSLLISHPEALVREEGLYLRNFNSEPMYRGQLVTLEKLTMRIIAINSHAVPLQVELQFEENLDNGNIELMYWQNGLMKSFDLRQSESRTFPQPEHDSLFERIISQI